MSKVPQKAPQTLELFWILREQLYVGLSFIAPLLVFAGSLYFLINQQKYGITTFFISSAVAFLITIYLLIFLVKRMIFKLKEGKIIERQKAVVKAQSKKQLGLGFLVFLFIVLSLLVTAGLYGTETGPFTSVIAIIDGSIQLAVLYSIYIILKDKGINPKLLKSGFVVLILLWLWPLISYVLRLIISK